MIPRKAQPCWQCDKPEAMDARAWLLSASDEDYEGQHSPSGRPLMCCKVRVVAQMAAHEMAAARATTPGWK